jgi:glycosyltransferase involved in cell wall biosynthesis
MLVNIIYNMLIGFIHILIERTIKPDLIYVRGRLIAFILLTLKPFTSKPIVFKFDNFAADEVLPTIKQKQLRNVIGKLLWIVDYYTLRYADLLLVNSNVMKNLIMEKTSIQGHKILICPPGIDAKKIEIVRRGKAPYVEDRIRLGFIGSLAWWQGVDILAEAVAIVREKIPSVELFIVGDGPMREKVVEICEKYKIKYTITGFVPHEDALKYLRSFDVLVLPSRKMSTTESNIPIKVIEAWALGVPVIVTRHKVFEFYGFKDCEDLVYCEPTPESVATALAKVIFSRDLHKKLSERGPQIAKCFDYQFISEKLTKIFKDELC